MLYREVGKTGIQASVVGLGTEHIDNQPYAVVEETVHAALDGGVNVMDLFMPGEEVRRHIGKAIAGRRDKVLIQGHIGSVDLNKQYDISRDLAVCKQYFEDLLRLLGTDYIDFGMLFFIDTPEALDRVEKNGVLQYVQDLKKNGTIRAIGASAHNPVAATKLVEKGLVDMLMFSINPAFDRMPAGISLDDMMEESGIEGGFDAGRAAFYRLCEAKGVGITVMKALCAGKLLSAEQTPFSKPLSVAQCIHYALTRPAVASVLVGCRSAKQVGEALGYLDATEEQRDYSRIISEMQQGFAGNCVYCNHCQPCPVNIDIASVHRYLDIALLNPADIPSGTSESYKSLDAGGADCIACKSCESRCPFGVPVVENMHRAVELFGS